MSERIARLRDAVRADLRARRARWLPPTTLSTTRGVRGWSSCRTAFHRRRRATITEEALSGDALDLVVLVADYLARDLLLADSSDAPMPYIPVGLSSLLFPMGCAPMPGSQAELSPPAAPDRAGLQWGDVDDAGYCLGLAVAEGGGVGMAQRPASVWPHARPGFA